MAVNWLPLVKSLPAGLFIIFILCTVKNIIQKKEFYQISKGGSEDKPTGMYGVCVACILCPEVRTKWDTGKIEIFNP